MKIFVFEMLEYMSTDYSPEGGLVIIAENKNDAIKLIEKANIKYNTKWGFDQKERLNIIEISKEEWRRVKIFEIKGKYKKKIFFFPAGGE